ncbi:MAG TPA: chemotaxis-specific protein-glutamate methyltransferase CheB [Longimicrobium sp.]|nr:chemotaxis-specific protein-glutamate methyltransferase CheB [Longimicrobium sp.]
MTGPARVLLVDDSAFVRRATERMLAPLAEVTVVGTATDGEDAVRQVAALRPDLVIMDVDMPGMNGVAALERIMKECPTRVLLLSSHTREGAEVTLRALEAGAVDFVDKSGAGAAMDIHGLAPLLRAKVLEIVGAAGAEPAPFPVARPAAPARRAAFASTHPGVYQVVAIGASTGGPRALAELIPALPAGFAAGVVVAQHMPAGFTDTLAERLDRNSALRVSEARDGDAVVPGVVLVAPGGRLMSVERAGNGSLSVRIWDEPGHLHRPSVDVLFRSVARAAGARSVAVVLTGMGSDGAAGAALIRSAGGRTLVESAETAVIDGMPGAARAVAEQDLPLGRIAAALALLCGAS